MKHGYDVITYPVALIIQVLKVEVVDLEQVDSLGHGTQQFTADTLALKQPISEQR